MSIFFTRYGVTLTITINICNITVLLTIKTTLLSTQHKNMYNVQYSSKISRLKTFANE